MCELLQINEDIEQNYLITVAQVSVVIHLDMFDFYQFVYSYQFSENN